MAENKIEVEIELLVKQAQQAVDKLQGKIQDFEGQAVKSFNKVDGAIAVFAGNILTNLVSGAYTKLVDVIKQSINAANGQEDAIAALNIALRNTGAFTDKTSQSIQDLSSELQNASVFADDVILQNAALIQSLGALDEKGLKRATKAAVDLAAGLRIDLASAAQLVGKAAAGEVGAFGRYGLSIEKGATNAETLNNALTKLEQRFGGAAQSQVTTFSGSIAQLTNAWGDLQEEIGGFITKSNAANGIVGILTTAINSWTSSLQGPKQSLTSVTAEIAKLEAETDKLNKTIQSNKGSTLYNSFLGASNQDKERLGEAMVKLTELRQLRQRMLDDEKAAAAPKINQVSQEEAEKARIKIASEKAAIAEINRIRQEQALFETEQALQQKIASEDATAQDIEDLKTIENAKAIAQMEAKLAANQMLKTEDERRLADQKAMAETELQITKNTASAKAKIAELEKKREQERVANQRDTLATISTLAQSSNKELAIIGKAAGLTQIAIDTPIAISKALAAFPPPFNFAAAGAVGAAMAAQAARLAGVTGFANGGVVGGFTGATPGQDNQLATVRRGEMFLNAPQQRRLFEIANGSSQSNTNQELVASINNLASQPIVVMIDNKEVARAVRTARMEGFVA